MKKLLLIIALLISALGLNAQTPQFVSKEPQNRNVLIEMFTGRSEPYSPRAHIITNELMKKFPGKVLSINIHTSAFSPTSYPNLNTAAGDDMLDGFKINEFPSGPVNRSLSDMSYSNWENLSYEQMTQQAECNIGGNVTIDSISSIATITVETYYTASSNSDTNYLTIMMLQDSIMGSQSGGSQNPQQYVDGQYCHMHVLRDIITDTWGDEVAPTTAGTLITKTYQYNIPRHIGLTNGVDVDLNNIHFVAFITEQKQDVISFPILNVCDLGKNVNAGTTINYYDNYSLKFFVTNTEPAECMVVCYTQPTTPSLITIPSDVTIDGISYSVTHIGNYAFDECSSLTSIEIPSSVTSIGEWAFRYCEYLTSVDFGENSQLTSIGKRAFEDCSSLTSIEIPSGVTSIGDNAFSSCVSLTSIDFGENSQLTSIGDNAFSSCVSLTSIDFGENSQLASIGENAFSGCSSLTSIKIPSGVTSIESNAFSSCVSLTSIEIPSGVTSIGSRSFRYCSRLTSIFCYAEDVPVAVDNTFEFCPADMIIYVPANSVDAYKLTSPWNRYTIKAIPTHCEVTVAVSPDKAGVVTGAGSYEINGNVTVTATANAGYTFVNWTENNKVVSEDAEYTFTITKDRILVANFIQTSVTYNVTTTVNPEKVGVVIGSGLYFKGDNVTLTAIPIKNGYEFVNWTEDGEEVSTDAQYSFVIESDRELVANFVLLDYYVSVAVSSAEAGEVTGDGNYNHGDTVALIATANEGYAFVNWTEDGEVVSSVAEYSFVILKDRNIVANFEKLEDPEQPEEPGEGVEELVSSFNIYPNPVSDKLYIETQTQTLTVEIYDIYGRRQSMVNGQQSTVIDVSDLNSGVYFVKVVTSEGEAVKRFVKK